MTLDLKGKSVAMLPYLDGNMSDACLDDCYGTDNNAIAPGTQSHDVNASCFGDNFHLYFCVRAATVTGLAAITFILSLYLAIGAATSGGRRPYRLIFFAAATIEMLLLGLYYGAFDLVPLLVSVQALKLNQYCLAGIFFLAHAARLSGQGQLVSRVIWPAHCLILLVTIGLATYTIVSTPDYRYSCASPGWLALTSLGCVIAILAFVTGSTIWCGMRKRSRRRDVANYNNNNYYKDGGGSSSGGGGAEGYYRGVGSSSGDGGGKEDSIQRIVAASRASSKRLWSLIVVCFVAALVQFGHDMFTALGPGCIKIIEVSVCF